MANYNSVEDIISAGTANATVIRNNSANDDGVDNVNGVNWFTYNGVAANTIYASGNSWFGFGANSEQLKVNQRDAKMYYLYREEGTLFNYYHFLKIRWRGYSAYSQSSSYLIEYDVILWETGDISLHMVNIPSSNNNGTYNITENGTSYSYTVSAAAPDVTFYKDGSGRRVTSELITINPPYDKKYLIRINGDLYDVDGEALPAGTTVNAATFETYGSDEKPTSETLAALENPDVLLWHDSDEYLPKLTATMTAAPPAQTLISNDYDMTDETITGIEDADVTASNDVLFAISFDEGETWKAHNGSAWITLSSADSGMSAQTFNSISVEAWAEVAENAEKFRIRAILPALDSYIESIIINFLN